MLLYLVRHGETDWNRDRRIQGSTDIPLNDTGRSQATAIGKLLAQRQWDAVVTSPLSRAVETAQLIAAQIGVSEVKRDAHIVERRYGEAEGMAIAELAERFQGMLRFRVARRARTSPLGRCQRSLRSPSNTREVRSSS